MLPYSNSCQQSLCAKNLVFLLIISFNSSFALHIFSAFPVPGRIRKILLKFLWFLLIPEYIYFLFSFYAMRMRLFYLSSQLCLLPREQMLMFQAGHYSLNIKPHSSLKYLIKSSSLSNDVLNLQLLLGGVVFLFTRVKETAA